MKYTSAPITGLPARVVNLIVIHCSATESGKSLSVEAIDAMHKARGFARGPLAVRAFNPQLAHIGYHFFIDVKGNVHTGRHAANFNARSIGICMAGGVERDGQYTYAQWDALAALVTDLATQYHIPLAPPTRHYNGMQSYTETDGICGHRDLSPDKDGDGLVEPFEWLKTCPGFDVRYWLKNGLWPEAKNIFKGAVNE
jgi:N-acetylmuramoyl-L-alanine amidase